MKSRNFKRSLDLLNITCDVRGYHFDVDVAASELKGDVSKGRDGGDVYIRNQSGWVERMVGTCSCSGIEGSDCKTHMHRPGIRI